MRWLSVFSVALFISHFALLSSHLAHAQSDAEHQQFLFAYKLLQRGDLAEAAAEFDEYLGSFPRGDKLGDAQYYRALLHRKNGDNEAAARLLEGAADPTLVPGYAADLLHGQVLSDLGRYEDALASLEQINTDELEPRVAVSAHYLRGLAYRGASNLDAAAASLGAAAELDTPMRARAMLDLAKVQALLEDPDAAVATLQRCLAQENADTTPEAARFAGDITYSQRRFDDAIAFYGLVVAHHQSSTHFAPAVVGTLWAQFGAERYTDLLSTFDRFREALPVQDRLPAWYLAGSAQQELGNHTQAAALLAQVSRGEGTLPIQEKILYRLAVSQFHLEERDAMRRSIAMLNERFPESPLRVDLAFLQATADAEQGQVVRGAARLTEFIGQGPDSPYYQQALLRRANLYETHEQPAAAADDYRAFLASVGTPDATSTQATFRLMELAGALGGYDEVKSLAQGLLAIDDSAVRTPEVEQEALYRQAVASRFLGELEGALALHDELARRHPLNPYRAESTLERGLIRMNLGDAERGVPHLIEAAGEETLPRRSRLAALRIVSQHYEDEGDAAQAMALRGQIEDLAGFDSLDESERLWMGRRLIDEDKPEDALRYFEGIEDDRYRERAMLYRGIAQRDAGRFDASIETLGELRATSERYALPAWLELARTLRASGEPEMALQELLGLISTDRDQVIAAQALHESGLIRRELAGQLRRREDARGVDRELRAARQVFKRVVLLHADRAGEDLVQRSYIELAEIAHEMNEPEAEATELQELVEKYPDSAYSTYAAGVLAVRAGRSSRAQTYLRQVPEQTEDEALRRRADTLLRSIQ